MKNMMRKISFLLLIVTQMFFVYCDDFDDLGSHDYQNCIEELEAKKYRPFADYQPGEVLVIFKVKIERVEAAKFLDSLDLKNFEFIEDENLHYEMVNVKVDPGKEFEIICELQSNDVVDGAYLEIPYNNKFEQFFVMNN